MKSSLTILGFFIAGLFIGQYANPELIAIGNRMSIYVLYVMMLIVGISIGGDSGIMQQLRGANLRLLLVPAATITGTLLGVSMVALVLSGRTLQECLMVGSGLGYYSLSSILITQTHGAPLGAVALIANVLRELSTILLAPLMVRYFSPLAPICCGGATTVDTSLPIIAQFSGKEFIFVAIIHGIVIDFSVPILVTLFSSF